MELNAYLIDLFQCLATYGNATIRQQITSTRDGCYIHLDEKNSVELQKHALLVNGQDIETKILSTNRTTEIIDMTKFNAFIAHIAKYITRINHIGISYTCLRSADELRYYKQLLIGTELALYEEASNDPKSRWFFIKGTQKQYPMFEIVLTESQQPTETDWIPHVQIDIDTTMSAASIIEKTNTLLAPQFISWNLDIPKYGIVLSMGRLGKIQGTNITIGIGSHLRGNQILKKL